MVPNQPNVAPVAWTEKPAKAEQPKKVAVTPGRIVSYNFEARNCKGQVCSAPALVVTVLDASGTVNLVAFADGTGGYTLAGGTRAVKGVRHDPHGGLGTWNWPEKV